MELGECVARISVGAQPALALMTIPVAAIAHTLPRHVLSLFPAIRNLFCDASQSARERRISGAVPLGKATSRAFRRTVDGCRRAALASSAGHASIH